MFHRTQVNEGGNWYQVLDLPFDDAGRWYLKPAS